MNLLSNIQTAAQIADGVVDVYKTGKFLYDTVGSARSTFQSFIRDRHESIISNPRYTHSLNFLPSFNSTVVPFSSVVSNFRPRDMVFRRSSSRKSFKRRRPLVRRLKPAPRRIRNLSTFETNFVDVSETPVRFTSTPGGNTNWVLLNGLQQGASSYNRLGTKVGMKRLTIHYDITPSLANTAAVNAQMGRVMIIYDRQANGAKPVESDVIKNYSFDGSNTSLVTDHLNMDNRNRFLVLFDRFIYLPPLGINGATPGKVQGIVVNPSDGSLPFSGAINLNLRGLLTQYNKNSTGLIGDIQSGSLYLLVMGEFDTNPTSAWEMEVSARLRFIS